MPRITVDGEAIDAEPGDTIAAALLRAGLTTFTRSIKYHRPRGPFCLSGTCAQCLMRVDGVPSLAACRVRVEEGMACERQNGPLGVEQDLLRAADFIFPERLDHHHLLTGSRVLGRIALEIARRLAGLGELPSRPRAAQAAQVGSARVVVIGGGRAGLAAAQAAGPGTLLVEREAQLGGSTRLFGSLPISDAGSAEVLLDAECVGLYANDTKLAGHALAVVRKGEGLLVVAAQQVICATGGASQPMTFPGVDRPGVYAARGLLGLPLRVGRKLVLAGEGDELSRCAEALRARGYELAVLSAPPRRALGNPVRAVDTAEGERIRCDAVAIALPLSPLHELASSAGAHAKFDGNGFVVETDADGRTAVPWLFAAGTVAGKPAAASGEAAGRACR